jgi:hypothetical protein
MCYIYNVHLFGARPFGKHTKTHAKFWNVRLEKDEEYLVKSREEWSNITYKQGGEEYNAYIERASRICCRNCPLKHDIEAEIDLMGRRELALRVLWNCLKTDYEMKERMNELMK